MAMTTDIQSKLANELNLRPEQVASAVALLDEGNTVPFIARYRKEVTGGLDEDQLRRLMGRLAYQRNLAERKTAVLKSVEDQDKLTPELAAAIHAAETLQEVEDLYLPFKPKRRTRASVARERGLEPLAKLILEQPLKLETLDGAAAPFLSDEVPSPDDAWAGARDIVAEVVSDDADVRARVRNVFEVGSALRATVADAAVDPRETYNLYYDFSLHNRHLKPHQVLAINRGEREKVLKVEVGEPEDRALAAVRSFYPPRPGSPLGVELLAATEDGYQRLIRPALQRETRRRLTEAADDHAIQVFATNLYNLLLAPPLRGRIILALDPGYRTGCKVAVISETGAVLGAGSIFPHAPQKQWENSKETLLKLIKKHRINLIAIGNGTASRETEQLAAELIQEEGLEEVRYLVVSEAGASVYSAMPLARQELPNLDVSLRGAVSIGRRTLDPLAELVKIDPRSIGVGLYQHDVDQKRLVAALDAVVESAVNHVGVNLNTASPALLRYVSGLGPKTAAAIVAYRDEHGPFKRRGDLLKVKGVGPKAYQQAAGFLRIPDGEVPLDNTGVHPESYHVVERLMEAMRDAGRSWEKRVTWTALPKLIPEYRQHFEDLGELAEWLDVGEMTLADILEELEKHGRDPRDDLPAPILRADVLSIEDLRPGMVLKGTVRNVVDFGAFVDIGVKQDGLLHVSEMAERRVRDPYAVVSVGDIVEVTVLNVDLERGRIALSLRSA